MSAETKNNNESPETKPPVITGESATKAPEIRENPDTVLTRKIFGELNQKLKDAMEFAGDHQQDREKTLSDFAKDFLKNLNEKSRSLLFKNNPTFIYPFKESTKSDCRAFCIKFSGDSFSISESTDVSNHFSSPSDEKKAPSSGPERIDKKLNQLLDEIEQKAKEATKQFEAEEKKSSFGGGGTVLMQMVNDYTSDCYSRFTVTEKALLMNKTISVNTGISNFFGSEPWRVNIKCFTNDYFVSIEHIGK